MANGNHNPPGSISWSGRRHLHAVVHRVQDAIVLEPERDWDMAAFAAIGHATERHLLRLFIDHAGVSPLHFLRLIRLERARQSLECGASVTRGVLSLACQPQGEPSPRVVWRARDAVPARRADRE